MVQPSNLSKQLRPSKSQSPVKNERSRTKTDTMRVSAKPRLRFLVQEHHARRLHWDFRLELDGVLKSWAVPKGTAIDSGVKRFAVEVEDRPLSEFRCEGTIAAGRHGTGVVRVGEKGVYDVELR